MRLQNRAGSPIERQGRIIPDSAGIESSPATISMKDFFANLWSWIWTPFVYLSFGLFIVFATIASLSDKNKLV